MVSARVIIGKCGRSGLRSRNSSSPARQPSIAFQALFPGWSIAELIQNYDHLARLTL